MAVPEFVQRIIDRADSIGHRCVVSTTPRGLWRCDCSCGYRSTSRQSRRLANSAAMHHLTKSLEQFDRDGVSLPVKRVSTT